MPARPQITTPIWVTQLIQNLLRVQVLSLSRAQPQMCVMITTQGRPPPQGAEYPFFSDLDREGTYRVRTFPFPVNVHGLIKV